MIWLITMCCFAHLGDRDYRVRERAQAILMRLSETCPDAVSDALYGLNHPDAEVAARWTAVKVCADLRCLDVHLPRMVLTPEIHALRYHTNAASLTREVLTSRQVLQMFWSDKIRSRTPWQFIRSQKELFDQ